MAHSATVLARIDDYYRDDTKPAADRPVRSQLCRQLAAPEPRDSRTLRSLATYKALDRRRHDWQAVITQTSLLSAAIADTEVE